MLTGGGSQKHDDSFPTAHISPQLLNATTAANSLGDNDSTTASKDHSLSNEDLSYDDYLRTKFFCDDFLPLEDDTLTDDAGIGIVEIVSPMEYINRLMLLRSEMGPSPQWCVNTNLPMLLESSRDSRHNGNLYWHDYYHMRELPAIRDSEDYHRNYLFKRLQSDPLTINSTSGYLPLRSPSRGISMAVDCLIEVDIREVGQTEDTTLVDGCTDLIERCCLHEGHRRRRHL